MKVPGRKRYVALVAAMVAHLPMPVGADQRFSAGYDRCISQSAGVTSQMLDCIAAELRSKDAELNDLWARVPAHVDGDAMTAVRDAQRAWIAFRDAECDAASALSGDGSLSAVAYSGCVLEITAERVTDLRRLVEPANAPQ